MQKWQRKDVSGNFLVKYRAKQFIELFQNANSITEFDLELYFKLIEKLTVFEGSIIIVSLLDGTDVECGIE
ncbi:hypothetical protein AB3U99_03990 [Niallia sp. JL1B1071]|uniref:hypothetical protein n=1 Tax=Niallia tiangongensis TaxID=3237105 RepID=UPI0037DDDBB4